MTGSNDAPSRSLGNRVGDMAMKRRGGDVKGEDTIDGQRPTLTLREMNRRAKEGGSEGPMKDPIDKELLQGIFNQKLHERPEVREALDELMNAIERDAGVREAFVRLQEIVEKTLAP